MTILRGPIWGVLLFLGAACWESEGEGEQGTDSETDSASAPDGDADTDTDGDTDTDTDADTDTDSDTDSDVDTGTETGPCSAMNAADDGTPCNAFVGVYWDGAFCRNLYCGCAGADCDKLYESSEACVAARSACMEPCPYSDWPDILSRENRGCRCGNEQYIDCCPDGMDFCTCTEAGATYDEQLICGEGDEW